MVDELDDEFFPPALKVIAVLCGVLVIGGFAVLREPRKLEPPDVVGCYSAIGAPMIYVGDNTMVFFQDPKISRAYRLEEHKGWVFALDPGIDWSRDARGDVTFENGWPKGQFLEATRAGDWSSDPKTFSIFSRKEMQSITYRWFGARCEEVGMAVQDPDRS